MHTLRSEANIWSFLLLLCTLLLRQDLLAESTVLGFHLANLSVSPALEGQMCNTTPVFVDVEARDTNKEKH